MKRFVLSCLTPLLALFLILTSSQSALLQAAEEKAATPPPPAKVEPKASLIELYAWTAILPKELIDLQARIGDYSSIDSVAKNLPDLTKEIKNLQWEISLLKTSNDSQVMQLSTYDLKLSKIKNRLSKFSSPVNQAISELSRWHKEWTKKKETLAEFRKQEDQSLALVMEEKKDLSKDINEALKIIEEQLTPTLAIGKKIGDLQIQLYAIDADLKSIDAEVRKNSIQQTSPSMLSKDFYTRINLKLVRDSFTSITSFIILQVNNLKGNYNLIIFSVIGLALIGWGIHWTRHITPATSQWYPFAHCPLAATIFIASANSAFVGMLPLQLNIPQEWERLLHIFNILAVVKLLSHIIEDDWKRRILSRMAFFLAFTLLLTAINLPQTLIFIYVFYVSIIALAFYVYQLRRRQAGANTFVEWFHRIWGVFPLLILLSGLTGYDQFATFFFAATLSTVVAFLIIWMLFRFNIGLLELICSVVPVRAIRDKQEIILHSLRPIIIWLHVFLQIAVIGVIWRIYPTINTALVGISKLGFKLGEIQISPGFIMTILLVLYSAVLTSRAIQSLLVNEVLPLYGAEKGVQMSIARLVHYAILTVAFFIMLRVLGFKLEQLTLLGGALGVGIGFGLQAIVNNFASGLILLFERPIKVGDTIQIGSEFGEVKELGLRATIIQTFDNAEIVIPNSDLVTGQVTNWTLANRKVRVRVPVGVAYGTDVNRVIEILLACAQANPMVLANPKPAAFFLAFGASSLDFELRAWVPEFLDKTQVLSDLNTDIESEFSLNNIEIPFPQTDLRLRFVDEQAANTLRNQSATEGDADPTEQTAAKG